MAKDTLSRAAKREGATMTYNEQIKALIEAGEKATKGEWEWEHGRVQGMYSTQSYTKDGEAICTYHWYPKPLGNGRTATYREDNADFVTKAANARQAIKDMAAENERLKMEIKTLRELREFDRKDIKTMRSVLELANRWFDKAINGDIMSAPDAGLVQRKIDEAL